MRKWTVIFLIAVLMTAGIISAQENIIVAGAGPSTQVVTQFFESFAQTPAGEGFSFTVPPRSIKHAGGIKAADDNLFGRTGRPLTDQEKGETKEEIYLARIPLTFVIDPDLGVKELTREQLEQILKGEITSWQQVGGPDVPVKLVGREPTEAALMALAEKLPEVAGAPFALRLRKDHQLVQMLGTTDRKGVLGFGAKGNFSAEQCLVVKELNVGLAVGLVYHVANQDNELVEQVRLFAASEAWKKMVLEMGMFPVD